MRVVICGSRTFDDPELMARKLEHYLGNLAPKKLVIMTGAQMSRRGGHKYGADYLAEQWAYKHGITVERFHPDWDKHGKAAGPMRNSDMLAANAQAVIAFWDGESSGTLDTITKARKMGLKVRVVLF